MSAYAQLKDRLERGGLVILDGGVGTEIVRRGVRWRQHGLKTSPETVLAVHREYIEAGADVITTNTFQLNPRTYLNLFRNIDHMRRIGAAGLETLAIECIRIAVRLALQAREVSGDTRVAVAGSCSPLNHCFRPDLAPSHESAYREHAEIARCMRDEGVDFILLESMNTIEEARAGAEAVRDAGLPVWVSFVLGPEANVLSGEDLSEAVRAVGELGADAVLINCIPPEDVASALQRLKASTNRPVGAYAHIGRYDPPSWKFEFFPNFVGTESYPPEIYARHTEEWVKLGARIVGGCCGTTPAHIRALKKALVDQP